MRAYVITTGILFSVITVLHVWEVIDRRHLVIEDPFIILLGLGLAVWAWRLAKKPSAP